MTTRTRKWSIVFERECETVYQESCHTANPCDDAYMGVLDLQNYTMKPVPINLNHFQNLPLFIIILESPHIDEFNTNGIAVGPAQGSTGRNIRSLLIQLLQSQTAHLQRIYRLMLVEAIPYQCSNNTSPIDRTNTNRLFKKMWRSYGGKIDFENRINQFNLSLTNKDGYLELRRLYNSERNPLDLFVLVAYSFNHQIRFNNSHEFNNPFGKERSCFNEHMKENLLDFLNALNESSIDFTSYNFDKFDFSRLSSNDFVYADPPYLITTGTYNDGKRGFTGWNEIEERKLLYILDSLDKRNICFALSNVIEHKGKENLILKDWIDKNKYYVSYLSKNYSNSNYHTIDRNPNATIEVLVTNYVPNVEKENLMFA